MATTCLKPDKIPLCVAETGFWYKKVIRKSFMYLGARKQLLGKAEVCYRLQVLSLASQVLSCTSAVPSRSASVIQRGHGCETQLQPLVPAGSPQPRLHCSGNLCPMKEDPCYTLPVMDAGAMPKRIPPILYAPHTNILKTPYGLIHFSQCYANVRTNRVDS